MWYVLDYLSENFVTLFLIIGMFLILISNSEIGKASTKYIYILLAAVLTLTITDYIEMQLALLPYVTFWRLLLSVIGYCLRPSFAMLLVGMAAHEKRFKYLLYIPEIINILCYLTAFFSPLTFYFAEDNAFQRGPLGYTVHIIGFFYIIVLFVYSVMVLRVDKKSDGMILLFCAIMCVVATIIETITTAKGILCCSTIVSAIFYYLFLHIQTSTRESIRKDALLTEQRTQLMISQIQPHFLYNTLATIKSLCHSNPNLAAETVENFSDYLRENMSNMGNISPIPFAKELQHTKTYAEIEMLRFPFIEVRYDIKDEDFTIPSLTVQPMVENAIRHGVRIRDHGIVEVRTYRTEDAHVIEIEDNGCGFVIGGAPEGKGAHIGLKNVCERVERMVGGTMHIESTLDVGTKITFTIPVIGE